MTAVSVVLAVLAAWIIAPFIAVAGWIALCWIVRRIDRAHEVPLPLLVCLDCGDRYTPGLMETHLVHEHPEASVGGEYRCADCRQLIASGCWPEHWRLRHTARAVGIEDTREWKA